MMKYNLGEWIWVKSPKKGVINKRKGFGQEIRLAFIEGYSNNNTRYKIQMLTKQDKENTNWIFQRFNGQLIEAREYYRDVVKESFILRAETNLDQLSHEELIQINEIRQLKRLEVNKLKQGKRKLR